MKYVKLVEETLNEAKVNKLKGYFFKKGGVYSFKGVGSNYGPSIDHKDKKLKDLDNSKSPTQFTDDTIEEMKSLPDGLYTVAVDYEYVYAYKTAQGWVRKFTKTTVDKELKKIEKNEAKRSGGVDIKDPGIAGRARDIERVAKMAKSAVEKSMTLKLFLKGLK